MRKNFFFGYNEYPDLFIDEDWYVPVEERTRKEKWMDDWVAMHDLQDRLPVTQGAAGILPLAAGVAARTMGQELVAVQPMNGPRAILNYLDGHYSSDKNISCDDPWYIWKKARDLDHKAHAEGRVIKKFYHVFAEPMTFYTRVRVGDDVRNVEQTPEQIIHNAETHGIEYWAELEAQASEIERSL